MNRYQCPNITKSLGGGCIIQTLPQSCYCKHSNTRTWINTRLLKSKISEKCRVKFGRERRISMEIRRNINWPVPPKNEDPPPSDVLAASLKRVGQSCKITSTFLQSSSQTFIIFLLSCANLPRIPGSRRNLDSGVGLDEEGRYKYIQFVQGRTTITIIIIIMTPEYERVAYLVCTTNSCV